MEQSPAKRKTIVDFFSRSSKRNRHERPASEEKTNSIERRVAVIATPVPGLSIHPDFVNKNEEQGILDFLNDARKCTWRTDLSRRTMHFGGTYCLMDSKTAPHSESSTPEVLRASPMPVEMSWLIERMVGSSIFPADQIPQYCIVNEYTGSQGISAHTENFQFGEPVVGLSLLSASSIRFQQLVKPFDGSVRSGNAGKAQKTGKIVDVHMPGRSLLVMRGQSRWRWQHEILRSKKGRPTGWKRVSLTFRYKEDRKGAAEDVRG